MLPIAATQRLTVLFHQERLAGHPAVLTTFAAKASSSSDIAVLSTAAHPLRPLSQVAPSLSCRNTRPLPHGTPSDLPTTSVLFHQNVLMDILYHIVFFGKSSASDVFSIY